MRPTPVLVLLAALAATGLAGCFHRDGCEVESVDSPVYVNHCPSYTYVKPDVDEPKLLADEKVVRGLTGVADAHSRLDGSTGTITVTVHRDDDIEVRQRLLALGYRRRW
jgi:hypothetical protein